MAALVQKKDALLRRLMRYQGRGLPVAEGLAQLGLSVWGTALWLPAILTQEGSPYDHPDILSAIVLSGVFLFAAVTTLRKGWRDPMAHWKRFWNLWAPGLLFDWRLTQATEEEDWPGCRGLLRFASPRMRTKVHPAVVSRLLASPDPELRSTVMEELVPVVQGGRGAGAPAHIRSPANEHGA